MKTRLGYLLLSALFSLALVTMLSCSDDKQEPIVDPVEPEQPIDPEQPEEPKEPVIEVTVTMRDASVEGLVTDTDGTPLAGVDISSGESSVVSNDMGLFALDRIAKANERFRFTFRKDGYFTVTRSGEFKEDLSLTVVMQRKKNGTNTANASFSATSGNTLKADGMQVAIPASSLVTADGKDYSGTVQADMLYLSPDNENFTTMMPGGDMAAIRTDESSATLISYGMTEVSLTDGSGNPLQLKDGKTSEMTFPIPESMKSNPPATIPLWYFNEEAGLWVEEGTATLKGDVYVGSVRHFSWHNLDVAEERVTIKGKVTDCKGRPVSRVLVTVDQTSDITTTDGLYSVYIPANTPVTVTVKSEAYNSYSPEVAIPVAGKPGGTTVENIDLELPCVPVISGRVTNSCSTLVGVYIWVEYTNNGQSVKTTPVWASSDGSFELRIPGTSGKATLWVQTIAGDKISREFQLTGQDLVITGLEICEKFDENTLTVTIDGGKTIVVPWISKNSLGIHVQKDMMIMCGAGMLGSITDYQGTGKESAGTFSYIGSDALYQFDAADFLFEVSDKGGYDVSITGSGISMDMTTGETKNAAIAGKVYIPIFIESTEARNVSKWSDVGMGTSIPEMPLPIDNLIKMNFLGMDAAVAGLAYKDKAESDYNAAKAIVEKAGYTIIEQEVTDEDGNKIVSYQKDDNLVMITFAPKGGENIMGDEEDYKLIIILCEGYSKIGQLGGILGGDTSVTSRAIHTLRTLKR